MRVHPETQKLIFSFHGEVHPLLMDPLNSQTQREVLNPCCQPQNPEDQLSSESQGQGQTEHLCAHAKEKRNTKFQFLLKQLLPKTIYHRMFKVPPAPSTSQGAFFSLQPPFTTARATRWNKSIFPCIKSIERLILPDCFM